MKALKLKWFNMRITEKLGAEIALGASTLYLQKSQVKRARTISSTQLL